MSNDFFPLGVVDNDLGDDDKPFSILGYTNGKGFYSNLMVDNATNEIVRLDLSDGKSKEFKFKQNAGVGRDSETHSGGDVGIYATGNFYFKKMDPLLFDILGPFAHMFHGVHEQSYIFHVMAYGACIGPYANEDAPHCRTPSGKASNTHPSSAISIAMFLSVFRLVNVFR